MLFDNYLETIVYLSLFSARFAAKSVKSPMDLIRCLYLLFMASSFEFYSVLHSMACLGIPLGILAVDSDSISRRLVAINCLVLALNWFHPYNFWYVHVMESVLLTSSIFLTESQFDNKKGKKLAVNEEEEDIPKKQVRFSKRCVYEKEAEV